MKSRKQRILEGMKDETWTGGCLTVNILFDLMFGKDAHLRVHGNYSDESKLGAVYACINELEDNLNTWIVANQRLRKENEKLRQMEIPYNMYKMPTKGERS